MAGETAPPIPPTPAQLEAARAERTKRLDNAHKQVRFDNAEIDELIPRIPREDATRLRRMSMDAANPRLSMAAGAAVTVTMMNEDGTDEDVIAPAGYEE